MMRMSQTEPKKSKPLTGNFTGPPILRHRCGFDPNGRPNPHRPEQQDTSDCGPTHDQHCRPAASPSYQRHPRPLNVRGVKLM